MRWAPPGKSRRRTGPLPRRGTRRRRAMARATITCSRREATRCGSLGRAKGSRRACWARSRTQQATRQNGREGGRLRDVWGVAPTAAAARRTPATWLRSGEDGGTIFLKIYMLDSKASSRYRAALQPQAETANGPLIMGGSDLKSNLLLSTNSFFLSTKQGKTNRTNQPSGKHRTSTCKQN